MRTISFLILLLSSITIYAQTFLTLELCDTFPKNFYQKTNLEFLKVKNGYGYCHSPIKILDDQILNFKKLKELRYTVPTNQEFLSTQEFFPKAILKLPELTQLEINFIVPEIFELTNLERLSIRLFYGRSKGTEALREGNFGNFKKLKTLSINFHNSFRGKLKGLSELVNLENVILYYPSPEVLKDILELPNLKVLRVVANREILDQYEIKEVKASEVISLRFFPLSEIPPSIFTITSLKKLDLQNTNIQMVSDDIGKLRKLESLNLMSNDLKQISPKIGQCKKLKTLYLNYNRELKTLPASIGKLKKLTEILATNCALETVPINFSKLSKLRRIELTDNKIRKISPHLFSCRKIETIYLRNNQLTFLSHSAKAMRKLNFLDISQNQVGELPKDIFKLKRLTYLSAYSNQLTELPPKRRRNSKIKQLHVSDNQLKEIPIKPIHFPNLQALEIQKNPLEEFPKTIYEILALKRVWISRKHRQLDGFLPTAQTPKIFD